MYQTRPNGARGMLRVFPKLCPGLSPEPLGTTVFSTVILCDSNGFPMTPTSRPAFEDFSSTHRYIPLRARAGCSSLAHQGAACGER